MLKRRIFYITCALGATVGLGLLACLRETRHGDRRAASSADALIVPLRDSVSERVISPIPLSKIENPPKAALGLALFRDVRFSKDNSISCQSCHDLQKYGADHVAFSIGIEGQVGEANSPSVFNSAFNFKQFWDGRAENLADQINGPIHNPKELRSSWPEILQKISVDPAYLARFQQIYGQSPNQENVTDAITYFESNLVTPNSPFDQFLRGDDKAISNQQRTGFQKFQQYGCVACHQGINVGGNMFQTLGVMGNYFSDRGGEFPSDAGRFALTKRPEDLHVFRVPSLRNVAKTAPYFHDGQVKTLEEAVRLMGKYQLGRTLSKTDIDDLVAFLNSLTGERPQILSEIPESAREKNN